MTSGLTYQRLEALAHLVRAIADRLDESERPWFEALVTAMLEERVGVRLAERLSVAELDDIIDSGTGDDALLWLAIEAPDYRTTLGQEADALAAELVADADTIVATSSSRLGGCTWDARRRHGDQSSTVS